jgi:hypothetical protein
MFGCLEIYPALSNIWATGLVLENYNGVVELICSPLFLGDKTKYGRSGPLEFADISSKRKAKRNSTLSTLSFIGSQEAESERKKKTDNTLPMP